MALTWQVLEPHTHTQKVTTEATTPVIKWAAAAVAPEQAGFSAETSAGTVSSGSPLSEQAGILERIAAVVESANWRTPRSYGVLRRRPQNHG